MDDDYDYVEYGEEPWRPAVESDSLQQLQDLVQERGLAVLTCNVLDESERTTTTPLLEAVCRQNIEMVRYLVEECSAVVDINERGEEDDERRCTSLHFATKANNLELVQYLVEKGCDVKAIAGDGDKTALHMAVEANSLELVRYLVEKGSDVNAVGRYGETPLHIAVIMEQVDIAKFLVDTGLCNLDLATSNRDEPALATALLVAVDYSKNLEIVKHLLERGAWSELEKVDRATKVLPEACKGGHLEIAKYLVESCQADVNANSTLRHQQGYSPLLLACEHGRLELVEYLAGKCHVNVDAYSGNDWKMNPLLQACMVGHLEIMQYLIEKCAANVKATRGGRKEGAPLHFACQSGKLDVVQYLVQKCRVDVKTTNKDGDTALHEAAKFGRLDVVQYLVQKCGSNVEAKNNDQWTALHMACDRRGADAIAIVPYFVDVCHANVDVPNSKGETALHIASRERKIKMVQCLIQSGRVNVNAVDSNGRTAMHSCLVGGLYNRYSTGDLENCLQIAKSIATIDRTSFETRDNDGQTVLHVACEKPLFQLVQYLVQECRVDVNASNNVGETALHIACRERHVSIVQCLASLANTDVNAADENDRTALHLSCSALIDEARVRSSRKRRWSGRTGSGDSSCYLIVQCLLKTGRANVNAQDSAGKTALHHSFVNPVEVSPYDVYRPDHIQDVCFKIVRALVESGQVNVDVKDQTGQTVLHYYCSFPNIDIPRYLIEHAHANIDVMDNEGRTALHRAASSVSSHSGRSEVRLGLRLILFLVSRLSTDLLPCDDEEGPVPILGDQGDGELCEREESHRKRQRS